MWNLRIFAASTMASAMLGAVAPTTLAAQDPAPAEQAPSAWIGMSFEEEGSGGGPIVVVDVVPGAPAREAGLRRGDRITRWNGRPDVSAAILASRLEPGDEVRVLVAGRGDQTERELTIEAVERPARVAFGRGPGEFRIFRAPGGGRGDFEVLRLNRDSLAVRMDSLNAQLRGLFRDSLGFSFRDGRGARPLPPRFGENVETGLRRMREEVGSLGLALATGRRAVAGAELTDITPGLSSYFGTDTGALVVRVAPESPAARAGLRDGDVILSVNGDEVEDVANLRWLLSRPDTRQFTLQVLRERSRVTIELGSGDV